LITSGTALPRYLIISFVDGVAARRHVRMFVEHRTVRRISGAAADVLVMTRCRQFAVSK
jgi:hypothetical protein